MVMTFKMVFVGTGVSTAVPILSHLLKGDCDVCNHARFVPNSKNKRNNVSIAIIFDAPSDIPSLVSLTATTTTTSTDDQVSKEEEDGHIFAGTGTGVCGRCCPPSDIPSLVSLTATTTSTDEKDGHIFAGTGTGVCGLCCTPSDRMRSESLKPKEAVMSPSSLDFSPPADGYRRRCILVDAGKTMRDACMQHFPKYGLRSVDAILLTHGHADAIFGLDDVRDLQVSEYKYLEEVNASGYQVVSGAIDVFLHQETMNVLNGVFSYLTHAPSFLDAAKTVLSRRVALLNFHVIPVRHQVTLHGLSITTFPAFHGGEYVSLGFVFGEAPGDQLVYVSDVKIFPEDSMAYLKSLPRINTLILDVLDFDVGIFSHMGVFEAIDVVCSLNPVRAYFVGMACSVGDHDVANEFLALQLAIRKGSDPSVTTQTIELGYDGLELDGFRVIV